MNGDPISAVFSTAMSSFKLVSPGAHYSSRVAVVAPRNCTRKLTTEIVATYKKCSPRFRMLEAIPRRILTNPNIPAFNNGKIFQALG